jgi:hypothetical protein
MAVAKLAEFTEWHDGWVQSGEPYSLKKELLKYCKQDCRILWFGCARFRQRAVDNLQMDPFVCSATSPKFSMLVFTMKFMKENAIQLIADTTRSSWVRLKQSQVNLSLYKYHTLYILFRLP